VLDEQPPDRGGWAYVSLLTALPGIDVAPKHALAIQFLLFETVAVALSLWFGEWTALPLATVGVAIATAGSALMLTLSGRIRRLSTPTVYRETLFHSSVDVVMGLVAFVTFLTYLLLASRTSAGGLFVRYLGDPLPAVAVFLGLFIAWDVCYRIGTAWWVSITGLWRTVVLDVDVSDRSRRSYLLIEFLTMTFALLQLLLVPFLWADRLLALAVLGHVVAVLLVSSVTAGLLLTD